MGLLMLQLARRSGAVSVDVVEPNERRRLVASTLGSSRVTTNAAELVRGDGWDVVIDATGNTGAIQDGLGRIARGGTYLQFGVASPSTSATMFTGNVVCAGVCLKRLFRTMLGLVSGRSSMTSRVLPCPDSLRMSRTPSIFPLSTRSASLPAMASTLVWNGTSVNTIA